MRDAQFKNTYWNSRRAYVIMPFSSLTLINWSQTKFVAIILVLFVFFNAIFRLAQQALSALRSLQLTSLQVCDSQKLFLETYTYGVKDGS